MSWQRTLKHIMLLGILVLAYFQRAGCRISEKEIEAIQSYWHHRMLALGEEVHIRSVFVKIIDSFKPFLNENGVVEINVNAEEKDEYLLKITQEEEIMKEIANDILKTTRLLLSLYRNVDEFPHSAFRIEKNKNRLDKMLLPALKRFTSVVKKINEYDSYMMGVLEQYSKLLDKSSTISEIMLFKLAKNSKMMAASIIYIVLFGPNLSKIDTNLAQIIDYFSKSMMRHIPVENITNFMTCIREDILKKGINQIVSANMHLHRLLCDASIPAPCTTDTNTMDTSMTDTGIMDKDTMNIYLALSKKDISEKEINQYRNITSGQVMKIIMLECAMSGSLLDHRRNSLFSVLGSVVQNVCSPENSGRKDIYESMRIGRIEQDKILDVLSAVWNDSELPSSVVHIEDMHAFCKENGITPSDIRRTKDVFVHAKWMYEINRYKAVYEEYPNYEDEFSIGIHFDMSYTHPLWHVYSRCEHVSHLNKTEIRSNLLPFKKRVNNVITLRPHKIKKNDDNLVKAENIKSCIKAWLSPTAEIKVVSRKEDDKEYRSIVRDFVKYLKTSKEKKVTVKKESEASKVSTNPARNRKIVSEESFDMSDIYEQ
ncbi:hypothetical protein NEMIN01_0353 [Nematocida minor]|uniref:uncharacterized protein n=1 Tax=Nematocida minor TaxID=1912983 RepID=UPI00221F629B|nr:uncharacterized protein NEMIN01_0353 [Nematocida minor]KAI5189187.1 hypothetical protein NEMIN01_0353 [Nematocida minor]